MCVIKINQIRYGTAEALEAEGISGVNIEKLARQFGITKSGFY
jgi:hypothetical protein